MKKIIITLVLILGTVIGYAQGIKFEEGLNWQQLKEKAKSENKFIFVDCYATWCGPCKLMDLTVYPNEKVGTAMKDKFLSVKIQFDETANDNERIKKWYETARALNREYKIAGYPTYLFFSPQGKLVYQALGAKDPDAFVKMVNYAMTDPLEKFKMQLAEYKLGRRNYSIMPKLIEMTVESGDKVLATSMLKDYKTNYLDKLNGDSLLTKERIEFLFNNYTLVTSNDSFFKLIYNQPAMVDSIWGEPIVQRFINYTISKEEIEDKLWKNDLPLTLRPDWKKIEANISKKYNKINVETVKSIVVGARFDFYKKTGNWKEFARLNDQKIKENPPKATVNRGLLERVSWQLNEDAWDVFEHCTDKKVLKRALSWIDLSIKLANEENPMDHHPQHLDTKANLLYKLGRTEEAIALQEKIFELSTNGGKNKGSEEAKKYIEKMKKGEATWKVK